MSDKSDSTRKPLNIAFQQPLFLDERIAADWQDMHFQITSATQLEAAYRAVEPEVAALDVRLTEADARQVVDLYNAAVVDGRFLKDVMARPGWVAEQLDLPLSDDAETAIQQAGELPAVQIAKRAVVPFVGVVAVVAVPVIVVVIIIDPHIKEPVVVDASGVLKL